MEDAIQTFIAFTGQSREVALIFVRGEGDDPTRAVEAFFDSDQDVARYQRKKQQSRPNNSWDESAWAGDRDGGQLNEKAVVPYSEPVMGPHPPAPSRPPSRTKESAQHVGSSAGWGQQNNWTAATSPRYEGEDEAIMASIQDQQTGITSNAGQDMSSYEIVPDADPDQRQREPGQPSFFKPLPNRDYFPAILSIVGQIPFGLRALAFEDADLGDYGYSDQWWRGEKIAVHSIKVHGHPQDSSVDDTRHEIAKECQRLAAFLQLTERSYGSVKPLAELLELDDYPPTYTEEPPFATGLERLDQVVTLVEDQEALFTSEIVTGNLAASLEWGGRQPNPKLRRHFDALVKKDGASLYDALDEALWGSSGDLGTSGWTSDDQLQKVAPIAVIRARLPDPMEPMRTVSIPETFFADRYMATNAERIGDLRKEIREVLDRLYEVDKKIKTLSAHYLNPPMIEVEASSMMRATMAYGRLFRSEDSASMAANNSRRTQEKADPLTRQLEILAERIDKRVADLHNEKERIAKGLSDLASAFTTSGASAKYSPEIGYQICGVASSDHRKPYTIYVADRTSKGEAHDAAGAQGPLWWKICYDTTAARLKLDVSVTSLDEALKFASSCNPEVVVVYVSQAALRDAPMPSFEEGLYGFVAKDNTTFKEEVEDAAVRPPPRSQMEALPPEAMGDVSYHSRTERRMSNDSTTVFGAESRRPSIEMMSAEDESVAFTSHRQDEFPSFEEPGASMNKSGDETPSTARGTKHERDQDGDVNMESS